MFGLCFPALSACEGLSVNSCQKQDAQIPERRRLGPPCRRAVCCWPHRSGSSHPLWWEQKFGLLVLGGVWGVFCEFHHVSGCFSLPSRFLEGFQSSTAQGSRKAEKNERSRRCSGISFLLKYRTQSNRRSCMEIRFDCPIARMLAIKGGTFPWEVSL